METRRILLWPGRPSLTISLWIWHAMFGLPECLNDVNVIAKSSLCEEIKSWIYPPPCEYMVNGVHCNNQFVRPLVFIPNGLFLSRLLWIRWSIRKKCWLSCKKRTRRISSGRLVCYNARGTAILLRLVQIREKYEESYEMCYYDGQYGGRGAQVLHGCEKRFQ